MTAGPGIAVVLSGQPIAPRVPRPGAGASALDVALKGQPTSHGIEIAGGGTVGTLPTAVAVMIGIGGGGTAVTGATRTGAGGAMRTGGTAFAPARAADAATGRGGPAARAE